MIHRASPPGMEKAIVTERDQHPISRKQISENALKVLYKLGSAGYCAYLVGGSVRDLLLGKTPKDFDVATNATPEELKQIFRNARIIGRRFKIVHIRFGREIIEVTTFRAPHEADNEIADDVSRRQIKGLDSAHSTSGMILRDNVYGSIDEDALRRDFTINALYYTTENFRILDFSTGLKDMETRQIRMIGDPRERYKEDPVRMLRAVRFSAKLDFDIEESTKQPIKELAHLLGSISSARLFDETLKLLTGGHAQATFALIREHDIGDYLFAPTMEALDSDESPACNLVDLALRNTDIRISEGKSVTPAFLFAALLWPVLTQRLRSESYEKKFDFQIYQRCANAVLMEQLDYTAVPKRFTIAAREIWELQLRLERRAKHFLGNALNNPRFRAGYDFLLLREESGEDLKGMGQWWTDFQIGDTKQRTELIARVASPINRRKRRKKNKPSGVTN